MNQIIKKLLIPLLLLTTALLADNGALSVLVFKDGKPVAKAEVSVDGAPGFLTDEDGEAYLITPAGEHEVTVVVKEGGKPLGIARKSVTVVAEKNTQVIVSLSETGSVGAIDVEAPEGSQAAAEAAVDSAELKTGTLMAQVVSAEDGRPVANARVFVKGSSVDAVTDAEGRLNLDLPEGERTLSVIHTEFSSQTFTVTIVADEALNKRYELTPASVEMEEFVVLAPHIEGSVAAVIAEEKNSESIANIIGSAQMSKQGDSNAASALKRVPGITLMGGKYIYVRGLGDRYSSTELNGMSLPSPNPIKRTVPLDMFPAGVIGSLQVQKTFTPDITGAFGGGYVNVRTKQKVDEDYVKIKVGTSMHSTFGDTVADYEGSTSDWTGYDHSYRPFDKAFVNASLPTVGAAKPSLSYSDGELRAMLQARDIDRKSTTVPLGGEAQIEAGKVFKLNGDHKVHVLGTYGYKSEYTSRTYTSYDYLISSTGVQYPEADNVADNTVFRTAYQHGGTFNIGYAYGDFDIAYTKLFVLNTLDQARDISGTFGENNSNEKHLYFEWQERELNIDQIAGGVTYDLFVKNRFDFGGETATASEYVPNDVFYNYKKYFSTQPYVFDRPDSALTYNSRTTDDELNSFFLKNRATIPMLSDEDYIEIGAMQESKDRKGRRVELTVESDMDDTEVTSREISTIINYDDGSHLDYTLTSQPKDQYDASLERSALYIKGLIKPTEALDLTFGGRYVDLTQTIEQYGVESNIITRERNELAFTKFLPSVAAKYALDEKNQFRLAYSETFIYPDFREFVNSEFIHPVFLAKVAGNPDLVETDIQSIDARYEYYFDETDTVNAALFYKHMDNPIEDTQTFTTSTLDRYSFANSEAADLAGIELSWYRHLGFLNDSLEDFILSGNYTYIYSDVTLTEEQQAQFVTQDRGLQGLSPHTFNLSLTYSDTGNRSLNLSYNKMSERLMRVALKNGDVILGLDDYEVPPHLIDFTWIEQFHTDAFAKGLTLTFKVKNLLDDETVWKQEEKTTLTYKTGRLYSLSLGGKF